MKKPTQIPIIEEVKLSELIIDNALSGRSDKEIADNAKQLRPSIEAFGSWDASQPGQYFVRDGKKHLSAGFTRVKAALDAGMKVGFFIASEDNRVALRTACIRTNLGKPISQFEQGRIYAAMRDGDNPETAEVGAVLLEPMAVKDIAAEVGYSRPHIEACIGIFEETPEIAQLIQDGLIAPGVAKRAKQMLKDDSKRLRMLKAAIKEAGGDTATAKHLDAVKVDFVPLKAATTPEPVETPEPEPEQSNIPNPSEPVEETPAPEPQEEMPLESAPSDKKDKTPLIDKIRGVILFVVNDRNLDLEDADIDALAKAVIDSKELPF